MKKLERSRREMRERVQDKSKEAVIARIDTLIDETNRQLDEHDAKMAQEAWQSKLEYHDPRTVGLNLPEHLVGNSADYRTKKRLPGVNKDGFTKPEVSKKINASTHSHIHSHTYPQIRSLGHFATFPFPFPLMSSCPCTRASLP